MAPPRVALKASCATLFQTTLLVTLSACSFTFGGYSFGGGSRSADTATTARPPSPPVAASPSQAAFSSGAHLGKNAPLGLEPMGSDQSPRSQLMNDGTLGYVLDHLFGGINPGNSPTLLPPSTYGTTTAGGVPGGLWPGNWWIQGQGGGYNLVHLP